MTGLLISFDGPDFCGKSVQAKRLVEHLRTQGIDAIYTREPGGTTEAEALRALLLANEFNWSSREEALLFATARAHHVRTKIIPHVTDGGWVICDRFIDSSLAYQAHAGDLEADDLLALHGFASGGLMPDLTFMIQISAEERIARAASRGEPLDRMEAKGAGFQDKVQAGYELLAERYSDRIKVIDGHGEVDVVSRRILLAVQAHLELHSQQRAA